MSTVQASNPLTEYHWNRQPDAEKLVRGLVADFLAKNSFASELARRMKDETGTRFYDWIESIFIPDSPAVRQQIQAVGYEKFRDRDGEYDRTEKILQTKSWRRVRGGDHDR